MNKKPTVYLTSEAFLAEGRSMMGEGVLPSAYGRIETTSEALAAATPPPVKPLTLRMTIVWDNEVATLDLQQALDHMRETGAAFVLDVKQVEG